MWLCFLGVFERNEINLLFPFCEVIFYQNLLITVPNVGQIPHFEIRRLFTIGMIDLSRYSIQPLEASHSVHTATNIVWNALLSIDDDHRVISHTSTVIKCTLAHKKCRLGCSKSGMSRQISVMSRARRLPSLPEPSFFGLY